jgi:hypothetical protein
MPIFHRGDYPLETTKEDVNTIFELVRNCPYIVGNEDYNEKAQNTKISYKEDENVVNAYADNASGKYKYRIVIFAGLCNAFKLGSLAMAEFESDKDFNKFKESVKWIGQKIAGSFGTFTSEDCSSGIQSLRINMSNNICREAKSYLAGSLLSVIGHELGHVILSHVLRGDTGSANSRNDERQADLAACAISESTPFARYSVLGGLIMSIIFTWIFPEGGPETESTHPHSRERVINWVNSHREYLESFGINSKNIDQFLP